MGVQIRNFQHTGRLVIAFLAAAVFMSVAPLSASASTTTWSPVSNLSATGGSAYEPQVATDPSGNTTIVWYRYNGSKYIVQAASKPFGGSWSAVTDLSAAGADAWEPKITTDPSGNVTAIWYSNDIIQTAYKPLGGNWSATTDLTTAASTTHSASVTADSNGNLAAVWIWDGKAQAAVKPFGGSWGAGIDLSLTGSNASGPQIISDSMGNFTAIWSRNQIIQSATLPAGGSWSAVSDLSAAGANASVPMLSRDSNGNTYAVWARGTTAQAAMKPAGGSWSSPTNISAPLTNVTEPKIVSDPFGNLTALWTSYVSSKYVTYTASQPAGQSWGVPEALSNPTQSTSVKGQLKSDTTGKVTAVWARSNGTNYIIQTASKSVGAAWGPTTDISAVGGNSEYPQLGIDSRGNVTLAWMRNNGANLIVQTNESSSTYSVSFDANGGTGSATPATYSTVGSALTLPSGTAFSRDGFVFAGWNTAADGSGANYAPGATFTPTTDVTLFAQWTAELAATGSSPAPYLGATAILTLTGIGILLSRRRLNAHSTQ